MPLNTGDVFAGYTIHRFVGSDDTGDVYLAQAPQSPRVDVLRILPALFGTDIAIAATLRHPHIAAVHAHGESDGQLWVATDYVDGVTTERLVHGSYPNGMPLPEVTEIITAVAEALDYAHSQGLGHGSVTPAHILVSAPGTPGRRILLSDFGIARSPQPVEPRADQYGLAATAFHLLTGNDLHPAAPRLGDTRPDLAYLDPVFARALGPDPYPRCGDFARAFAPGHQPTQKSRATLLAAILIPVLLAAVLLGTTGFAVSQFMRADPGPSAADPQWQPYVATARNFAVALTSIRAATIDADVQRVLDGSTGPFHDEFQSRAEDFKRRLTTAGSSSEGMVTGSGLASFTTDHAVVLVSVNTTTTNSTVGQSQRLALTVTKVDGAYKVSEVELLP